MMASGHIGSVLRRLRALLGADCAAGPTDGELLRRYVTARDEAAFEALLRRHGPMVLGVCRRLLGTSQDVDDAFQATFLILIRKAPSIGDAERVANWLYGVAYRVAVRARAQAARQRARQRALADVAQPESTAGQVEEAVRVLLDEEVNRLPARYREAVVCCYLEGRTQEETARLLGWPKGTVATRLNRARELLRTRLTRRGLVLTGGTLAGLLTPGSSEGAVPPALVATTLRTAGQVVTGGVVPAAAGALARGVLREFLVGRAKAVAAGALAVALAVGGGALTLSREGPARVTEIPPMPTAPLAHQQAAVPTPPRERDQAALPAPSLAPETVAMTEEDRDESAGLVIIIVNGHDVRIHTGDTSIWVYDPARPVVPRRRGGRVVTIALGPNLKPSAPTGESQQPGPRGKTAGHTLIPLEGPAAGQLPFHSIGPRARKDAPPGTVSIVWFWSDI